MAMVVATAEDTSNADSSAAPTTKGSRPPIQSPQFSSLRGTASVVVATSRRVHSAAQAFRFGTAMALLLVVAAARGALWSGKFTRCLGREPVRTSQAPAGLEQPPRQLQAPPNSSRPRRGRLCREERELQLSAGTRCGAWWSTRRVRAAGVALLCRSEHCATVGRTFTVGEAPRQARGTIEPPPAGAEVLPAPEAQMMCAVIHYLKGST
ncbi:uncharacterized protein LOC142817821 [Rhipicephalus microplus]|uniref:uncharacterized protein LOC142817821 n=1 Tax=Rhipicephalus microplus TaxID=6941 RepID=UPI003F6A55EC